jgi:type IV pilus assembly protein PilC
MPEFTYTAITKDGHRESATIQAASLAAAGHLLKEQGLLPTFIEAKSSRSFFANLKGLHSISLAEKINFIQNLGVMLKAGISVSRGLQILVKQTKNARFKDILGDIASQVESGKNLADALGKYPGVFSQIFTSMIKVGEMSGNLDKSLEYLSIQLQREADLKSRTRGAMIYPSVIVGALVIIGIFMSIWVLPNLTSTFKESGVALPVTTRIVVAFADFMSSHAVLAISGLIGTVAAVVLFLRTEMGKTYFDIFLLHFMVINTIVKKINLARFSRILSSLLKSGIPIVQGLEVASESLGNTQYQKLVAKSSMDVKLGKPLTDSLGTKPDLFPVLVVQMLQVGEESGTTENILEQLAQHYEEEVDVTLKNLSTIIEPILLLFIGGVVGLLAVALISPIYSIGQNIQ